MPDLWAMIYVLAYPQFEPKVAQSLAAFRALHEPERARLVAPHLTLVFGVEMVRCEDVTSLCSRIAAATPTIPLTFSHSEIAYDPFEKTHKIFLMCDVGADLVTDLHNRLYDGPHRSELHPEIAYRAHMTVATNPDLSTLEKVDLTPIGPFPIKAEISSLDIVALEEGQLHPVNSFALAGEGRM